MKNEDKLNIIRPFGPAIGSTTIPQVLIEKINNFVDEVIKDEKKSKKLDYGQRLAGEVTQEIFLPNEFLQDELLNFLNKIAIPTAMTPPKKRLSGCAPKVSNHCV